MGKEGGRCGAVKVVSRYYAAHISQRSKLFRKIGHLLLLDSHSQVSVIGLLTTGISTSGRRGISGEIIGRLSAHVAVGTEVRHSKSAAVGIMCSIYSTHAHTVPYHKDDILHLGILSVN